MLSVDSELGLLKIEYKDGTLYTLEYGEEYSYATEIYITQDIRTDLKEGDSFKKGDILIYNAGFFQKDPFSNQVDWKHGTFANVAIIEEGGTFEDSSVITRRFSKKMNFRPVYDVTVAFKKTDVIVKCMQVGDTVDPNDQLIILEDADLAVFTMGTTENQDTEEYLLSLGRVAPKARHSGTIVKMNVFYGCPLSEMHSSTAKVIRPLVNKENKKKAFAGGSKNDDEFYRSEPLPKNSRYKRIEFDEDTVVIEFFIQASYDQNVGDKLVLDSSLKSIVADVLASDVTTVTSNTPIDVIFSGSSISNRIILSPILVGLSERVLEKLEQEVIELGKQL